MGRVRPRGMAPWSPSSDSLELVRAVREVLAEYQEQLPLTLRQVFYRLVASRGYEKTEQAYGRLGETLNRARRAGLVPFEHVRDGGVQALLPQTFGSPEEFLEWARENADVFALDRQHGQSYYLEVWVEAAGMARMVADVALQYGVPVYSAGGFDSTTCKHDAALRFIERDNEAEGGLPTVVLHLGDYDASGVSLFVAAAEDVTAFVDDLYGDVQPEFVRVAVTEEQIDGYGLPSAPPKRNDKRGVFTDTKTVQCEAFEPDQLQEIVREAIVWRLDEDVFEQTLAQEREQRAAFGELLDEMGENGE
jgi:hypothetical protein